MPTQSSNLLLDALPESYGKKLLALMEPVSMPIETVLYSPGETPRHAHFMTSGISSIVTFMTDGGGAEVAVVGHEGVPESLHLLGSAAVPTNCFVQLAGTALRMPFARLQKEFLDSEPLHRCMLQLVQHQALGMGQVAACNRLHEVEERLARWLLMVQDRIEDDVLHLTQEFLAEMLGARRTTVTMAAGSLQRSGLIEYRRGRVHILDRENLISAACECYPILRNLLQNLYK